MTIMCAKMSNAIPGTPLDPPLYKYCSLMKMWPFIKVHPSPFKPQLPVEVSSVL